MVPASPDDITDSWLTEVLRDSGTMRHATVTSHVTEPVKAEIGAATLVRLVLDYDEAEDGAPRSVVAKLPSTRDIRSSQDIWAGRLREVRFYQHLSTDPGIPTPRCYHAEIDERSGAFVLLLEDLSDCRVGTVDGRPEDAELAVRHLAQFHAHWWNSERLRDMRWFRLCPDPTAPGVDSTVTQLRDELGAAFFRVREVFGRKLPQPVGVVAEWLVAGGAERLLNPDDTELHGGALTLVHGDYHPAQIFFPAESGGRFVVFDWETVHVANGGQDLARIIVYGLAIDQRADWEDRLVRLYHATLTSQGVIEYDIDRCWLDVRHGLLYSVVANLPAASSVNPQMFEKAPADVVDRVVELYFGRLNAALRAHNVLDLLQ
jgi:hypothetical protein